MALVEEFNAQAGHGGRGDFATLVVVDREVLAGVDDGEVLAALDDHGDCITDVDGVGGLPVLRLDVVNIDACSSCNYHITEFDAHVDNPLWIIKHFIKLVEVVDHGDFFVLIKHRLDIVPVQFTVNDVAEGHSAAAASSRKNRAIVAPAHIQDGASLRLVK